MLLLPSLTIATALSAPPRASAPRAPPPALTVDVGGPPRACTALLDGGP